MSLTSFAVWQKSIWMIFKVRKRIAMRLSIVILFVVGAYQIRGLARIRQNNYNGAIEDYQTALKYDPENLVLWHNLSLCHMQKEDYDAAKEDLGKLLKIAPGTRVLI